MNEEIYIFFIIDRINNRSIYYNKNKNNNKNSMRNKDLEKNN
jgi:hypothetical protein